MANASFLTASFLGGEISKVAQGDIVDPRYKISMAACLNGVPMEAGNWSRRPGFAHAGITRGGTAAKLITWDFQETTPYTMEFTDNTIRFRNGERLATTNDTKAVSAISSASPAVVTTSTAHGWSTGDTVFFDSLSIKDPLLLNRQFVITVTDTNKFSIVGAVTGASVDGSALLAFGTGNVKRVAEIITPYELGEWSTVRSVQAQLQSVLLHGTYAPQVLTATPPAGALDATFAIAPAQFMDGPYLDPVVGAVVTPSAASGIVGFTITSPTWSSSAAYNVGDYVIYSGQCYRSLISQNYNNTPSSSPGAWVAVAQGSVIGPNGLQSSDIGRHVRLFSEPAAWASGTTYAAGTSVKYNNTYYTSVVGSNLNNTPGLDATKWIVNPAAAQWTWGRITSTTGAAATLISPSGHAIVSLGTGWTSVTPAFDGTTSKTAASCATNSANYLPMDVGLGLNFSGGQAVSYALVYAPNNGNYVVWSGTPGTLTFNLRGKNGTPSGPSDGTLLGSVTAANFSGEVNQIFSNDTATTFTNIWIEVVTTGNVVFFRTAQLQFFTTGAYSGTGFSAQIMGPPLLYTTAITTWRLGLFTSATGYPKCGTYHEGRLWLSGLVSNRVDASALVDIYGSVAPTKFYFTPTLYNGTVSSACAINYTLDGPDVNAVFWLEPDQQGIIAGTQAGEWLIQATTQNAVLSPLNMQAHRVTRNKCANILPVRTENTVIFVQRQHKKLMEYFADVFSGKFSAPNLLAKARHLAQYGIEEIAYQREPSPILWARRSDGALIGASYKRDTLASSQGPTFIGWHRHVLGSGRTVVSICSGTNASGVLDTLTAVTYDSATGIYHVEALRPFFEETDDLPDAWQLDNAITPAFTAGASGITMNGLWHLNGKTVTVFAGGLDCGEVTVANGAATLAYGANTAFTKDFVASQGAAMPLVVGFTFTSRGQLVKPDTVPESGARNGPGFGKVRRIHKFAADIVNSVSGAISFGTDFDRKMYPAVFKTPGGTVIPAGSLASTLHKDVMNDTGEGGGQIAWEITRPYPANIAGIGGFLQTTDE